MPVKVEETTPIATTPTPIKVKVQDETSPSSVSFTASVFAYTKAQETTAPPTPPTVRETKVQEETTSSIGMQFENPEIPVFSLSCFCQSRRLLSIQYFAYIFSS